MTDTPVSDDGLNDINAFLARAVRLEQEAALRFDELADACNTNGNAEVAGLFRRMAEFSRMHLAEAKARAGFHDLPDLPHDDSLWPDGQSPESAAYEGSDPFVTIRHALDLALDSERAGLAYYQDVADGTSDPEVKMMAEEFVAEESEHVAELERWIARYDTRAA